MTNKNVSAGRFCAVLLALILGGCANDYARLDSPEHQQIIEADHQTIHAQSAEQQSIKLSMDEALARALEYNLDARVSALEVLSRQHQVSLEQLKAFPGITLSTGYQGRSNLGASSSKSVLTGRQSLEPSVSTEQHRRVGDLGINWNLIDIALAAMQTGSAKDQTVIAQERHNKVLQTVERDVYGAYWRAYAAQQSDNQARSLIAQGEKKLRQIDKARSENLLSKTQAAQSREALEKSLKTLHTARANLSQSDLQLKSLLNYPPETKLVLTSRPKTYLKKARQLAKQNAETLEIAALENRPEMRESIAKRNIALRDTRMEVVKTFPGIKLFAAYNWDSNQYLQDNRWQSFSATILENITSLITAPARYRYAKNVETIEEARRTSLAAAIITQVHLSRMRLASALDIADASGREAATAEQIAASERARQKEGFSSGVDAIIARIEALNANMGAMQDMAEAQDAAAGFMTSLGQGIGSGMTGGAS